MGVLAGRGGRVRNWCGRSVAVAVAVLASACGGIPEPPVDPPPPLEGAEYVGAEACQACHANVRELHQRHGHSQALKLTDGAAPMYPAVPGPVGVPDPPEGFAWSDIAFVIGGYTKAASFVDASGFVLTDAASGEPIRYNLAHPPTGSPAGFVPSSADDVAQTPYAYERFAVHTTGPQTLAESGGLRQGNRPGIQGRWAEPGVQCEACHGPGSLHLPAPSASSIEVDTRASACARCHANAEAPFRIAARDGFIAGHQQFSELAAGPHAGMGCTVCHDPHVSVIHDRDRAIRNDCLACHGDQNMALHAGQVFVQGDYVERLSCESCHMPPASRIAASAVLPAVGEDVGRIGDTRTHIFWINTQNVGASFMFTGDGTEVARDALGRAAVTVDFACLRCHHGAGNAFELPLRGAATIADGIHGPR